MSTFEQRIERGNIGEYIVQQFLEDEGGYICYSPITSGQHPVDLFCSDFMNQNLFCAEVKLKDKMKKYNEFVGNHPEETEGYKQILKIALTYPAYARIERYPIAHVKSHKKDKFPEIDSSFYAFRSSISHNKSDLMYYPPYSNYVRNFLYNQTM